MKNIDTSGNRLKVLIIADDCNPDWQSLPALVYKYIIELSKLVDITLATQIRNRENLENQNLRNIKVIFFDTEYIASPLDKLSRFLTGDPDRGLSSKVAFRYPSYIHFETVVWKHFKKDVNSGKFDIVHRVSPMSPTIPSPICKWNKAVPTVIGPLLSSPKWPKEFKYLRKKDRDWIGYLRNIHKLLAYYRSTFKHADAILAAYPHTIEDLPKFALSKVIDFSEGGVEPEAFTMPEKIIHDKATILFVGRLVPFKQPEILIECFHSSSFLKNHRLVIIGDGPERSSLEVLVNRYRLSDCVKFTGVISQNEVAEYMRNSEILAFPSIREQGGGVLTLAGMSGMACVVVDYGGPSYRVPSGAGVKIPMCHKTEMLEKFRTELENLIKEPNKIISYGIAARKFTEQNYTWEKKASNTLEVYDWVLGNKHQKPEFVRGVSI